MFKACVSAVLMAAATSVVAQPAAGPVTCNSPDPNYAMAAALPNPNITLWYWNDPTANVIHAKARYDVGNQWFSIGFSQAGHMMNSAVLVAQPGTKSVAEYWLSGESAAQVNPAQADGFSNLQIKTGKDYTEITFDIPTGVGSVPVQKNVPVYMITAAGPTPTLSMHTERNVIPFAFQDCTPASN